MLTVQIICNITENCIVVYSQVQWLTKLVLHYNSKVHKYWYLLFYKHIDNFLYGVILIFLKNYEFYNILKVVVCRLAKNISILDRLCFSCELSNGMDLRKFQYRNFVIIIDIEKAGFFTNRR